MYDRLRNADDARNRLSHVGRTRPFVAFDDVDSKSNVLVVPVDGVVPLLDAETLLAQMLERTDDVIAGRAPTLFWNVVHASSSNGTRGSFAHIK
jgi:hypothetical protein